MSRIVLNDGSQSGIKRKPGVHRVEVMRDAGINTLPRILSTVEDDNKPGALAVAQEDPITMAHTVERQQAGVVEKLLEQPLRHVLHHHPVPCGVPKLPHADALRYEVWPPDITTAILFRQKNQSKLTRQSLNGNAELVYTCGCQL